MRWGRRKKQFASVAITLTIFIIIFHIFRHRTEKLPVSLKYEDILFRTNHIEIYGSQGYLNVAIWMEICGYEMKSLKEFPLFPHRPSRRMETPRLRLYFPPEFENSGLRIFGFLSPIEDGNYNFYLSSSETSELWISSNSKPENGKMIARTTAGLKWKHRSDNIPLLAGVRYYLELLVKHGPYQEGKLHHIHVTWKSLFWREQKPDEIPSNVFIPFDSFRTPFRVLPIHAKYYEPSFVNDEVQRRAEMYRLPFISEADSKNLFPLCPYNPSYLVAKPLERYQSTWELHYSSIYPFDYSDLLEKRGEERDFVHLGNDELDENTARAVVTQVWTQILKKHPGKYSLQQILNVEEKHDKGTGDRYLVELELQEIASGKSARFSEYVYKPWGAETLCSPEGMAWNKSAVINILLTTGNNQGRWILHFLGNLEKIYNRTKDSNFNVIITDFDSKDLDIENSLKQAVVPNSHYAKIKDKFSRALGLQLAAEMVNEPNSILFAMDLHIDIPYHFLDDVRKHCIQNKVAYSPFVIRLSCGAMPSHPIGYWEVYGLGLMGIYKSDWEKVGGMNIKEFKTKWGGEDWEMADRILESGMEIEILKMMHFFHYYHSKKGMWTDNKNSSHASQTNTGNSL